MRNTIDNEKYKDILDKNILNKKERNKCKLCNLFKLFKFFKIN